MPFVNEKISEEDKVRIDWKKYDVQYPSSWTIDRDRDAFLIRMTLGRPDGLDPLYLLSWKGSIVEVNTRGQWEPVIVADCVVESVRMPPDLENHRAEILAALKEAFIAHGFNYDGVVIKTVHIK